jgi:drug/metabolite transporter (DMT)-like permease
LDHYAESIPPEAPQSIFKMMPFAGTYIRAVAGFVGFFLILALMKQLPQVGKAVRDRKGMLFATLTTFFGPFLGVSLSLMAVQYAKAGIASTLMALTPVLIIVPYALIHKQKISAKEVVGTLITMVGVALFFLL